VWASDGFSSFCMRKKKKITEKRCVTLFAAMRRGKKALSVEADGKENIRGSSARKQQIHHRIGLRLAIDEGKGTSSAERREEESQGGGRFYIMGWKKKAALVLLRAVGEKRGGVFLDRGGKRWGKGGVEGPMHGERGGSFFPWVGGGERDYF